MSTELSKRALSAGLGIGALALLAPRASADTPFSSFAFPATGATAPRTMPDRLAEIKNVKDFGALGNGTADDTAAIQAAINWTANRLRGKIYFPPGTYRVTQTIQLPNNNTECSFILEGDGKASTIVGNFSGYIFSRNVANGGTAGVYVIRELQITNGNASGGSVLLNAVIGAIIENCHINANICVAMYDNAYSCTVRNCIFTNIVASNPPPVGSIGVLLVGTAFNILGCDFSGFDHGVRLGLNGTVLGCRFEMNTVGIMGGMDQNGGSWASSVFIAGCSFEANSIHIHAFSLNNSHILSCSGLGDPFSAAGSTTISTHGLRIRGGMGNIYSGITLNGQYSIGAIVFDSPPDNSVFLGVTAHNAQAGVPVWILPTNSTGLTCINCNNPTLTTRFADLPGNPTEGMEFNIRDSATATWGATATGGGPNHVLVRYNGSAWTVVGR